MLLTALRPYQVEALDSWRSHQGPGFGLFMQQRTGKLLTALAIVDEVKPHRLLVVVPRAAFQEWESQLARHIKFDWEVELKLLTYGQLDGQYTRLKRWITGGMVVADESHRAKGRSTLYSRRLRSVGRKASHRLALSGTAMGQGPQDLWAQFNFLDPGIFGKWTQFRARYCIMGGFRNHRVVGTKRKVEFSRIMHQHSFRVTLREVQENSLRIRHQVVTAPLGREQRAYLQMEEEMVLILGSDRISAPLAITQAQKLQQICGGFVKGEERVHLVGKTKLRMLIDLWDRLDCDHVVICANYRHEIEYLRKTGESLGLVVQTIDGRGNKFDPENPANWIIVQTQAGEAIDLSVADSIIFYSWNHSFINYDQLKFRVIFYNAKRVSYYYLVMKDTVDESLFQAVRSKQKLFDLLCDRYRRKRSQRT